MEKHNRIDKKVDWESIEDGSPASWYGLLIARELLLSQYYGDVEEKT